MSLRERVAVHGATPEARRAVRRAASALGDVTEVYSLSCLDALVGCGAVTVVCVPSVLCLGEKMTEVMSRLAAMGEQKCRLLVLGERDVLDAPVLLTAATDLAARDRRARIRRIREGREGARARGVKVSRPPAAVDVERAVFLLHEGRSMRSVARELGISPRSLRRKVAHLSMSVASVALGPEDARRGA